MNWKIGDFSIIQNTPRVISGLKFKSHFKIKDGFRGYDIKRVFTDTCHDEVKFIVSAFKLISYFLKRFSIPFISLG